ncbi:MAG TPA: hypothetical protein VFG00_14065 [Acidothermaceae bacterium]|nr:hypothetical protein [Acidothermaceae bacterium]
MSDDHVTYAPHVCQKCLDEDPPNYNGVLVFSNQPQPVLCRYHKTPLVPVLQRAPRQDKQPPALQSAP